MQGVLREVSWYHVEVTNNLTSHYVHLGYLIDIKVLQDCIQTNVGNVTFDVSTERHGKSGNVFILLHDLIRYTSWVQQEAFKRTKRVLNITVPSSRKSEGPQLLNYITSPNVVCDLFSLQLDSCMEECSWTTY